MKITLHLDITNITHNFTHFSVKSVLLKLLIFYLYFIQFNHLSGYFPIVLVMYCRTTYNDASA